MGNPYAPLDQTPNHEESEIENEVIEETIEGSEEETEEVPEGSIKELKAWVGDDKDKAQLLLDDENSKDEPRKTLVKALEEIING